MPPRPITPEEKTYADELLKRARVALKAIECYDQARVDRLCQAIGWATANEKTFTRVAQMGVDESGLGDREGRAAKRFKIMGILRDILRQKSVGVIEEIPEKGIVKYGKPVGVDILREAKEKVSIPVFAIGGIKEDKVADVMKAGADGVAVISGILGATDIRSTTKSYIMRNKSYV